MRAQFTIHITCSNEVVSLYFGKYAKNISPNKNMNVTIICGFSDNELYRKYTKPSKTTLLTYTSSPRVCTFLGAPMQCCVWENSHVWGFDQYITCKVEVVVYFYIQRQEKLDIWGVGTAVIPPPKTPTTPNCFLFYMFFFSTSFTDYKLTL